jgi:hypothetical protein
MTKPTIWKRSGMWYCRLKGSKLLGVGASMKEAYLSWRQKLSGTSGA